MWQIAYSKEVRNYSFDSYPYTEAVWQAVKSLKQTSDGIPSSNYRQLEPNVFLWETVEHVVLYERNLQERRLTIFVMKPTADEW